MSEIARYRSVNIPRKLAVALNDMESSCFGNFVKGGMLLLCEAAVEYGVPFKMDMMNKNIDNFIIMPRQEYMCISDETVANVRFGKFSYYALPKVVEGFNKKTVMISDPTKRLLKNINVRIHSEIGRRVNEYEVADRAIRYYIEHFDEIETD